MECVKESSVSKPKKKSHPKLKEVSTTINVETFSRDFEKEIPKISGEIPLEVESEVSSHAQDILDHDEEISFKNSLEDPLNINLSEHPTTGIVASLGIKGPVMADLGMSHRDSLQYPSNLELVSPQICSQETLVAPEISFKMLRKELELKMVQLKKDQLGKERQLAEEDFKVRTELLEAEMELALAKTATLNEQNPTSSAAVDIVQNQTVEPTDFNRMPPPSSPPLLATAQDNQVISSGQTGFGLDRMPVPAVVTNAAPLGLQQLNVLDCVTVRKLRSLDLEETYEVVAPRDGLVMFRANVTVRMQGDRRVLRLDLIDNEVKEVATFKAGPDFCMDLYICGHLAAKMKKVPTYFKPMLMVHDQFARPVLKVKGPSKFDDRHTFHVQTLKKQNIGAIDKRPAQATQHYDAPHAIIRFPGDLDVRFKIALVAANFLIVDSNTCLLRERRLVAAFESSNRELHHQYQHHHQYHNFQHMPYPTRPDF